MKLTVATALAALCLTTTAMAAEKPHVEVLVKGTQSWDGTPMSYPEGTPEISVMRITLTKDTVVPMHCHPMPLAGVMTKGKLEVFKKGGGSKIFNEGDAIIEMMGKWHRGLPLTDEAQFIVVYAGAEGMPTTIKEDSPEELRSLCHE